MGRAQRGWHRLATRGKGRVPSHFSSSMADSDTWKISYVKSASIQVMARAAAKSGRRRARVVSEEKKKELCRKSKLAPRSAPDAVVSSTFAKRESLCTQLRHNLFVSFRLRLVPTWDNEKVTNVVLLTRENETDLGRAFPPLMAEMRCWTFTWPLIARQHLIFTLWPFFYLCLVTNPVKVGDHTLKDR